jgi:hypothetical protein
MNFTDDTRPLDATQAASAIAVLKRVEARLSEKDGALIRCIGFAKDAAWAAAYPDDPIGMLGVIAAQAENAMG